MESSDKTCLHQNGGVSLKITIHEPCQSPTLADLVRICCAQHFSSSAPKGPTLVVLTPRELDVSWYRGTPPSANTTCMLSAPPCCNIPHTPSVSCCQRHEHGAYPSPARTLADSCDERVRARNIFMKSRRMVRSGLSVQPLTFVRTSQPMALIPRRTSRS